MYKTAVFQVIMILCMVIAGLGAIADAKDKRNYQIFFGISGVLFLASVIIEKFVA